MIKLNMKIESDKILKVPYNLQFQQEITINSDSIMIDKRQVSIIGVGQYHPIYLKGKD